MKKFQKLSKAEMREIKGGVNGGGCPASECSADKDCANSQYGKSCYITKCLSTGEAANYCYNA